MLDALRSEETRRSECRSHLSNHQFSSSSTSRHTGDTTATRDKMMTVIPVYEFFVIIRSKAE